MTPRFSLESEADVIARFAASRPRPIQERSLLTKFSKVFRKVLPGETPLNHSGHTTWVAPWLGHARTTWANSSIRDRLCAFARLAHWLFREGMTDDDAFAHVEVEKHLAGSELPLVLRYNLHRLIERFVASLGDVRGRRRSDVRVVLLTFNTFLNRALREPPPPEGRLEMDATLIRGWFQQRSQRVTLTTLYEEAGQLHRCLELGVREGVIAGNAMRSLLEKHGGRGLRGIVEASLALDMEAALAPLRIEPRFASAVAGHIDGFLASRRALGYRLRVTETTLANLDRYLRSYPSEAQRLSATVLDGWIATTPAIGSGARRARWTCARQLCQYIQEDDPGAFVPELPDSQRYPPSRPPFIYSADQIRRVLEAALELGPHSSLRPRTYHALIALLYGAGLRISEALRFNLGDADLEDGLLLIRETKFYKSRWIPLAPTVALCLKEYAAARAEHGHSTESAAAFFVNQRGRRCTYPSAISVFLALLRRVGLRGPAGAPGPRLHDLRHAFAVHRLSRWYEEGADVQAKLPLLSTYLGHSSVFHTQRYLTVTADLLHVGARRFYAWRRSPTPSQEMIHAH